MGHVLLQVKDAIIRAVKSLDPETDVFFEEIPHTDEAHGIRTEGNWYFLDLVPSGQTVDGTYTDLGILVDIAYHEKHESNTGYLIRASELDSVLRPVLRFGSRRITIPQENVKITDHVLHYSFSLSFRNSEEKTEVFERMRELDVAVKKEREKT